jgi:hypothetical protein
MKEGEIIQEEYAGATAANSFIGSEKILIQHCFAGVGREMVPPAVKKVGAPRAWFILCYVVMGIHFPDKGSNPICG